METSSSPDATARRLAVVDQETDHTGWLDWALGSTVLTQELPGSPVLVQMMTVPSSEQLAMVSRGTPMLGAHATSRTQSVCPARVTHSSGTSPAEAHKVGVNAVSWGPAIPVKSGPSVELVRQLASAGCD